MVLFLKRNFEANEAQCPTLRLPVREIVDWHIDVALAFVANGGVQLPPRRSTVAPAPHSRARRKRAPLVARVLKPPQAALAPPLSTAGTCIAGDGPPHHGSRSPIQVTVTF